MCWCTDNWHAGISCSTKSRSRGQACGWFVSWNIWASLSFFILTSYVFHECWNNFLGPTVAPLTHANEQKCKKEIWRMAFALVEWMRVAEGRPPVIDQRQLGTSFPWIMAIQQPNTIWSSETARFAVLVGSLSARISEFLFHWSFWDATTYINVSIAFWLLLW